MFDIVLPAKVVLIGGLTAAAVMLLAIRRTPHATRSDVSWIWAIGLGVWAAASANDQWPHWPPLEDRGRFLTLLVPLAVAVETVAATVPSRRVVWGMRIALASVTGPILLYNSVYLADLNGPGSAEWSAAQAAIVLCGLAIILAVVWAMLSTLEARTSTAAVMWPLVLDALAVGVTVMLSGYYGGGLLGLGLAGAVGGATLGSHASESPATTNGYVGIAIIGILSVVLMGRFFGSLSTGLAACLLVPPLAAWIVELPRLRGLAPSWRSTVRLACVAVPLMAVVIVAQRKFVAASAARSQPLEPGSVQER